MRFRGTCRRRGVTLVEGVIVFAVLLAFLLSAMDLALAVFRSHLVTEAARQGARQAIVHGDLADALGTWGPATVGPLTGTDTHPLAQAVSPYLAGFDLSTVSITAEWPDGGSGRGMRVRVTIRAPYQTFGPALAGTVLLLSASSTMPITH